MAVLALTFLPAYVMMLVQIQALEMSQMDTSAPVFSIPSKTTLDETSGILDKLEAKDEELEKILKILKSRVDAVLAKIKAYKNEEEKKPEEQKQPSVDLTYVKEKLKSLRAKSADATGLLSNQADVQSRLDKDLDFIGTGRSGNIRDLLRQERQLGDFPVASSFLNKNMKSTQSSTTNRAYSYKAIDGIRKTYFDNPLSCTHTQSTPNQWWEVDLGAEYNVVALALTNRGGCCSQRLTGFDLSVIDNSGTSHLCKHFGGVMAEGQRKVFVCDKPVSGNKIKIFKPRDHSLTLCEVEAAGNKLDNIALGRPAAQSSTQKPYLAEHAVDKNVNQCSRTKAEDDSDPWWQVDLLASFQIKGVKIASGEPLGEFKITVHSENPAFSSKTAAEVCYQGTESDSSVDVSCGKEVVGSYLRVTKTNSKNALILCEVTVRADKMVVDK